jgi:hypothetical protein
MYSELIYTRCRQGIDILKSGRPISSDGFKVYSCTSSLMEDGNTDLPFLFNAAQGKQPYTDPAFMDDAYLYFVPEKGDAFMVDFHPIPYDAAAQGDYSHRAGNFVNQILAGDYSGLYPFELFRDHTVWNAQARGEAFYYENAPTALPPRGDISDPAGQIDIDALATFISDGRREALMAAVSFLIAQFEQPAENRKFLIIRDESSANIELWIAAIEYAFSPRIAAAIPFATRLDKFATTNRYTVNQLGVYQTQINLQDPNQKQRYRAMIVGVDERDKINAAAVRPLANSPFVLLDGREKKAAFEADVSHRYYRFITAFDDAHKAFCREFLQMFDVHMPGSEILRLYDIYTAVENSDSLPNAGTMAKMLSILGKYQVFACSRFKDLYKRINDNVPRFLQENLYSALDIIKWMQTASHAAGDSNATDRLTKIVCTAFAEQVFGKPSGAGAPSGALAPDAEGAFSFWQSIKDGEFASAAANYIVAPATRQSYETNLQGFGTSDAVAFVLIYIECVTFLGTAQDLKAVVDYGLKFCVRGNDTKSAQRILKALSQNRHITPHDILLSIAGEAAKEYAGFIIKLLIETDASILASDLSMQEFFEKLRSGKLEHLFAPVLKYRLRALTKPAEIEQFVKLVKKLQPLSGQALIEIYEALDSRIVIGEKGSTGAALIIQQEKPEGAKCTKSAHLYALDVLNDKSKRTEFIRVYNALIPQGFPVETNPDYIRALTEKLLKAQMTRDELGYIIQLFSPVPEYIAKLAGAILDMTTSRQNDEWTVLIGVAAKKRDKAIDHAIIEECARLKHGEKALAQLGDMLEPGAARDYFGGIAGRANEIIRMQKPRSGLGRLFGGLFSGDGSDADSRGKKG